MSKDPDTLTMAEKAKMMYENPLIVEFFKDVLKPISKVREHYCRLEYGQRGSCHSHGLLWLEDAPIMKAENLSEDEF